jgi:hypothetical protein
MKPKSLGKEKRDPLLMISLKKNLIKDPNLKRANPTKMKTILMEISRASFPNLIKTLRVHKSTALRREMLSVRTNLTGALISLRLQPLFSTTINQISVLHRLELLLKYLNLRKIPLQFLRIKFLKRAVY